MNKILLIGNSGLTKHGEDGQTIKVRLYLRMIKSEGFDIVFVDLENFVKNPLSILLSIKKNIKICDRIVLITASRGCKILIPLINRWNKNKKKPFVLPLIGISVLHNSLRNLSIIQKQSFLVDKNYSLVKPDNRTSEQLKKTTYILPETELLVDIFRDYYKLDNVYKLNNFRDIQVIQKNNRIFYEIRLVFLSRVMEIKGIFDLLEVVKDLTGKGCRITLDVYGKKIMTEVEEEKFNSYIDDSSIKYKGTLDNNGVLKTLSNYDLLVFPTRYMGEGTPGVISESLIAGTPVLTSEFAQARFLLRNGIDSIFYKMLDKEDLKSKLLYIINNKDILKDLREGAIESGKQFTYEHERKSFLKYVCGVEEE